jgi:AcrR family transcriptional regulator
MRKDGEKTREQILHTACEVFAERGYRDATHAEICEMAGANIAAINYHYGSKEKLYREVCAYAIGEMNARFPLGENEGGAPEEKLTRFVAAILGRGTESVRWGFYHRIRMREFSAPSGIADDLWNPWFERHRTAMQEILTELLVKDATPETLQRCHLSVMGPCFLTNFIRASQGGAATKLDDGGDLDTLVDHIVGFALAGIDSIRNETAGIGA